MRRGEIWTVSGGPAYAGKPRPAVILQADIFHNIESTTVCLFTSDAAHAPTIRIPVYPTPENGLRTPSWLMVDKLVTVPRDKLGTRVGILDPDSLSELSRAVTIFLNLAPERPLRGATSTSAK